MDKLVFSEHHIIDHHLIVTIYYEHRQKKTMKRSKHKYLYTTPENNTLSIPNYRLFFVTCFELPFCHLQVTRRLRYSCRDMISSAPVVIVLTWLFSVASTERHDVVSRSLAARPECYNWRKKKHLSLTNI